jgi:hypothetical protein
MAGQGRERANPHTELGPLVRAHLRSLRSFLETHEAVGLENGLDTRDSHVKSRDTTRSHLSLDEVHQSKDLAAGERHSGVDELRLGRLEGHGVEQVDEELWGVVAVAPGGAVVQRDLQLWARERPSR